VNRDSSPKLGIKREPAQARSRLLVEKLCETTLELAAERGLRNLNTNLIAARAGVDISSLYRFFASKEAILFYIADEWLAEIRAVYSRFEQDPVLLALPWQAYFTRLLESWSLPGRYSKYAALEGLWNVYPELHELEQKQLEFHVEFFLRQLKRFGARGSPAQWRPLAIYSYFIDDAVNEVAARSEKKLGQTLTEIYRESLFLQLVKLLDSGKTGSE
jgi:AcrR family transcriptional regulator